MTYNGMLTTTAYLKSIVSNILSHKANILIFSKITKRLFEDIQKKKAKNN